MNRGVHFLTPLIDLGKPLMNRGAHLSALPRSLSVGTHLINQGLYTLILLIDLDAHSMNDGVHPSKLLMDLVNPSLGHGAHLLCRAQLTESIEHGLLGSVGPT
jgi:hypothetical protein